MTQDNPRMGDLNELVERVAKERDRHVIGYPGPRRDVAELLDHTHTALTSLIAERDGLREALTPSGATKAAYIGEFSFGVTLTAGDEEEYRRIQVPWTTIKEIMAAISERAAFSLDSNKGDGV